MTTRISTTALGAVTPYIIVGSLALTPGVQAATRSSTPETAQYVRAATVYRTWDSYELDAYFNIELGRPDLIPNVIVSSAPSYPESYEPFIIAEGWREETTLEGPFLVEEASTPVVDFDDYDRATIGLYE